VIGWHRRGFARVWAWKSRPIGRLPLAPEPVSLIEQMARENPLWSRRRINSELAKLGHRVDKDTIASIPVRFAQAPHGATGESLRPVRYAGVGLQPVRMSFSPPQGRAPAWATTQCTAVEAESRVVASPPCSR
jgi:hypothetical protein